MRPLLLFFSISFLFSCSTSTSTFEPELSPATKDRIEFEVNEISNAEQLASYLKEIQAIDQSARARSSNMEIEFGEDSEEMRLAVLAQMQLDLENLKKIELILLKFGYPGSEVVGRNTSDIPLIIIHHSPNYQTREKHFETLYTVYLDQQINENLFSTYLGGMYRLKFDARFDMPEGRPFTLKQEVDTLIQILSLR